MTTRPQPHIIVGVVHRYARDVRIGDRLDLLGNDIADDYADDSGTSIPESQFEFATVLDVAHEIREIGTAEVHVVVIKTPQGTWGFPADHAITIDGEQETPE